MFPVCCDDRCRESYSIEPRTKNIAFAITIIVALSALLVGVLGYYNFDPFGGIGTIGSQVLMYGGAALLLLSVALKIIDHYCRRASQVAEPEETTPTSQTDIPTPSIVTEAPKTFPFLDEIKLLLQPPQVIKESDIEGLKREPQFLLQGILNGSHIQCNGIGIEHPSQLPPVFAYLKERIQQLNSQLEDKVSEEIPGQKELEGVCTIWSQLLIICKDPSLTPQNLDQLKACGEKLPDTPEFYKNFTQIHKQLQNLVSAIFSKPTEEDIAEVVELFHGKLGKELDSD